MVAPEVPRITIDELKATLASARNVLVIDTRDPGAYETAHIRGAINIPYSQVAVTAPQLPRSAKIVFYCA
jgi:rhodanese-related sulfurtransferase